MAVAAGIVGMLSVAALSANINMIAYRWFGSVRYQTLPNAAFLKESD
jgi:hypothetical protein